MKDKNVAYSSEYQGYRKQFDYIFSDKYKSGNEETKLLSDGKHTLRTSFYRDESHEILQFNAHTSKTEVLDYSGNKVAEVRNINCSVDFFSEVEHSNGKRYLLFSIDLYGYSIMDLSNYKVYDYIPEESFSGQEETFIWTDVLYCRRNNVIAVDGCIWACPSSTYFYDFSNPEQLPYDLICSSYDMEGEINIDTDVTPLYWNEDGTIVLRCCIGEDSIEEIEKTIDIISRVKKYLL